MSNMQIYIESQKYSYILHENLSYSKILILLKFYVYTDYGGLYMEQSFY